jgi:hypothetical protein
MGLRLLDEVELKVDSGRWPRGTGATVVELFDTDAMVEIIDEEGRTSDLLTVPHDALVRVPRYKQERLPA